LTWDGVNTKGKKLKVRSGSTLIAVSQHGAKVLLDAFARGDLTLQHWDLSLLHWLRHPGNETNLGACYVYPSVGHYKGYVSDCTAGERFRAAAWASPWVQQGTRRVPGIGAFEHRWLLGFPLAGLMWLHEVRIPEEPGFDLRWKTLRPPPEEEDVQQRETEGTGKPVLRRPAAVVQELPRTTGVDTEDFAPETSRAKRARRCNLQHYAR
jgi:hypothetical protein